MMILTGVVAEEIGHGGWGFYRALTIDHTLCGAADSANFPVLVNLTHADLKSVSNGGHVNGSSGFDIAFTADSAGSTLLWWELVGYTPTTGRIEFWVMLPTLSHLVDTVIYLQYGKSGITTDQSATTIWPTSYKAVYHLGDGTTLGTKDSSQSANDLTNSGGAAVTGKVGGGVNLNGGSNLMNNASPSGLPTGSSNPITMECWFKLGANQAQELFAFGNNTGSDCRFAIYYDGANHIDAEFGGTANTSPWTYDTNWHHAVIVLPTGATNINQVLIYFDGALATTTPGTSGTFNLPSSSREIVLGQIPSTHGTTPPNCSLDELRLGTYEASASWVTSEFNNQNAPGTFMSVGGELTH